MSLITKALFRVAKSRCAAFFIGTAFEHLSALMPLDRQYEDGTVVVFKHPVPSWPVHLVAVPKKRIRSFLDLALDSPADRRTLLVTLQGIRAAAQQHELEECIVLVNGGKYQEVAQIHFHLISGDPRQPRWRSASHTLAPPDSGESQQVGSAWVYPHLDPRRPFHYIARPGSPVPGLCQLDFSDPAHTGPLIETLAAAQTVIAERTSKAYMLGAYLAATDPSSQLVLHIVSGRNGSRAAEAPPVVS